MREILASITNIGGTADGVREGARVVLLNERSHHVVSVGYRT